MTHAPPLDLTVARATSRVVAICETDTPLCAALGSGRAALAVICGVDGPSYRPLGAMMVVDESGRAHGNLSSGCIERDVILHARQALADGRMRQLRYGAGSPFRDLALPCGGGLDILVNNAGIGIHAAFADTTEEQFDENAKNKPILLIVEDNSDMRQYIRSILITEFNILEAPNGLLGLEITNRYQPDLIISDIMMPEMDGMEFCKRLKTNFTTSHIPVILLTAKSATDTQIESFNIGADAFLVKPFDEDLLKAIIQNLSEKRNRKQLNFAESMDTEALNFKSESLDKKFIDKALKVIKENYTNPDFDVTEFIEVMGISRSLLHKKLKNLAGQSASRFIRVYRLNIARELIIKNRVNHSLNKIGRAHV